MNVSHLKLCDVLDLVNHLAALQDRLLVEKKRTAAFACFFRERRDFQQQVRRGRKNSQKKKTQGVKVFVLTSNQSC